MNATVQNALITLLAIWLLMTVPALAMSSGDYEVSWSTIDGGGGRSTGGDFALVGTIGQPDAGEMAGGDYELSGGFWPRGPILSCFVNFEHFAEFALYWLDSPCNEGNNWCEGADLDYFGDVDLEDVKVLAYYRLTTCPADWPWQQDGQILCPCGISMECLLLYSASYEVQNAGFGIQHRVSSIQTLSSVFLR